MQRRLDQTNQRLRSEQERVSELEAKLAEVERERDGLREANETLRANGVRCF